MKIASHLEKIGRFNGLRARLDPIEDFELWFWTTMTAGTGAVNAALHHARITPEEQAFPSQPGVYSVPDGKGGYCSALKKSGDVLHVGRPPIPGPIPEDIGAMMQAMERIEHFRDPCTRGDMKIDRDVVATCDGAYAQVLQLLDRRLAEKQP